MCWMSVLRPSAVMPTSQCSTSPCWMTGSSPSSSAVAPFRCTVTLGWNQVPKPRSLTRWRNHRLRREHRVDEGPVELDHVGEHLALARQAHGEEVDREPLGGNDAPAP